jgi:quercetin dioxygenase-like cupin family protein
MIAFCSFLQSEESNQNPSTHRVFQFENEHVRVWKTVIMPNQPLKMHRHDCARVVVGLKGGSLTKLEDTGETSELIFETGKAYWLNEDPPNTLHGDVNESNEPIEVMVIEIKSLDTTTS